MESRVQWSRVELKGRSKLVLRTHYWRVILVALLLIFLIDSDSIVSGAVHPIINQVSTGLNIFSDKSADIFKTGTGLETFELNDLITGGSSYRGMTFFGVIVVAAAAVILVMFVAASGIAAEIFVINPLYVGAVRFFVRSFDVKPQYKELFYAFENRYKNVVKVMFLRDLYTVLWCLLLVVPGIVKSYEYLMIPYILAENPAMETNDAFALSRQMMYGQKWKAFVLDLSFLGWNILSGMTFGILSIFFVEAYSSLTHAALYRKLRGLDQIPQNVYYDGMEEDVVQGWYEQPK